jgi:hypothetical protein
VEEDALDLPAGHGQQDGRERLAVHGEDEGGLPVQLPLRDGQLRATGRRRHEGRDLPGAGEGLPEVADAPEHAALGSLHHRSAREPDRSVLPLAPRMKSRIGRVLLQ